MMVRRESIWTVSRLASYRFLSHERKETAVKKNAQPPWAMLGFLVNVVRLVLLFVKHPPFL
jgi:hypothetical protein